MGNSHATPIIIVLCCSQVLHQPEPTLPDVEHAPAPGANIQPIAAHVSSTAMISPGIAVWQRGEYSKS